MRVKKMLKKLFCLSGKRTAAIALPAFLLVALALFRGWTGAPAYAAYLFSAYGLAVSAVWISRSMTWELKRARWLQRLLDLPFVQRWRTDVRFRTRVSLYLGFAVNLLYVAVKFVSGVLYRANWFVILAVYYAFLAVMRVSVLSSARRSPHGEDLAAECRRCRSCGVILLILNIVLSVMVSFIIVRRGSYDYPGTLVFFMAAYTFYMFITAAVNLARYRKFESPLLFAAKVISMTAALVSMLALETALLDRFGDGDDPSMFREKMIGATGAVICAAVVLLSVAMILRGRGAVKKQDPA